MSTAYCFDRFEVLPVERRLLVDGQPAAIGARAFDLLTTLVENPGRLLTKSELLDRVWPGLVVEEANLHVQVSSLRKLLGPEGNRDDSRAGLQACGGDRAPPCRLAASPGCRIDASAERPEVATTTCSNLQRSADRPRRRHRSLDPPA